MDKNTQIVFLVFTALMLVTVLIEAGAILAMLIAARKAQKTVETLAAEVRAHVLPLLAVSRTTVDDLKPKITRISANLVDSTNSMRAMAAHVNDAVGDVANRTKTQVANVDGMIQETLDQIGRAGDTLQQGLAGPMRQLSGIFNAFRAGLDVMRKRTPSPIAEGYESPYRRDAEEETFQPR